MIRKIKIFLFIILFFITNKIYCDNAMDQENGKYYFDGNINNKYSISMCLNLVDKKLSGIYQYMNYKKDIIIHGTLNDDGEIKLLDINNDLFTGRFILDKRIEGIWSKADHKISYPFYLTVIKKEKSDTLSIQNNIYNQSNIVFHLWEGLSFENEIITNIKRSDIPRLIKKKVLLFTGDYGLELVKIDDLKIIVYTIEEYRNEINNGAYALTTIGIKQEEYFKKINHIFLLFENAQLPKKSIIKDINIDNLNLMPVSIIPKRSSITDDPAIKKIDLELEQDSNKGATLSEYLKNNKIKIIKKSKIGINFLYGNYFDVFISEISRGDFNNDGFEDILINENIKMIDGTLNWNEMKILLLKSPNSKFQILKIK
ncbi:MAG: hypothetical protein PHF84_05455 [bacterium]|nr:hypothetical protein [bacterium]